MDSVKDLHRFSRYFGLFLLSSRSSLGIQLTGTCFLTSIWTYLAGRDFYEDIVSGPRRSEYLWIGWRCMHECQEANHDDSRPRARSDWEEAPVSRFAILFFLAQIIAGCEVLLYRIAFPFLLRAVTFAISVLSPELRISMPCAGGLSFTAMSLR